MTDTCAFPRLASPHEAYQVYLRGYGDHTWPPPATTVYDLPLDVLTAWVAVCGNLEEQQLGASYWCTLYELYGQQPIPATVALQVAKYLGASSVLTGAIGVIGHWPAIYTVGRGIEPMDWLRVTMRGILAGGEQFQHKFDFRADTGQPYPINDAEMDGAATNFRGWWESALSATGGVTGQTLLSKLGGTVIYTEVGAVKLTQSAAGGQPTQEFATAWSAWPTGSRPGGSASFALPNEVALCVTLQSDTRGARGRGRTYLPPLAVTTMAADGTFLDAAVASAGHCINSFLQQVVTDGQYVPVVVSLAGGASHEITSASIGKVPDSQRRRRRSQVEANVTVWTG